MSVRGYASAELVGDYLGTVLTADGTAQANICIEAAENRIDQYTGRRWLAGTVASERVSLDGPMVYLKAIPVSTVGTVTARNYGSTVTTALVVNDDYELIDADLGLLTVTPMTDFLTRARLASPQYDYLQVSYVPGTVVPMGVQLATTMLAARYLQPSITEFSDAIEKTAGDVTLRYDPKRAQEALPAQVMDLLAPYRRSFVA